MSGTQFVMTSKFDSDPKGISSSPSTSAPRNNRSAWLSGAGSKFSIKTILTTLTIVLFTASAIVAIPFAVKRIQNKSAFNKATSYHNHVTNSTGNLVLLQYCLNFSYIFLGTVDFDNFFQNFDDLHKLYTDSNLACDLKPESRQELGRGTWSLLHIMASAYPPNPTPQTIQEHKLFFQLLPRIYPCPDCRQHMRKMFHELPPRLNSQQEFVQWICEAHNRVNARLGKPIFDCTIHDERWDCGCGITPGKPGNDQQPSQTPVPLAKPEKERNRESRASRKTKNGGKI